MMRALLIGYNDGVLSALDNLWPEGSIVVLEEPDLWEQKHLALKAQKHASLDTVRFGRYQQDRHFLQVLDQVGPVDAVAPGLEYAVVAAAEAAHRLGLRGAGVDAAETLRDKLRLRERTTAAGMRGPAFREVGSAHEVAAFAQGRDCVVKPACRQASLGVVLLDAGDDPQAAWKECVEADEGNQIANRSMAWRYMAEDRLYGPEFSTESLVCEGRVVFTNVTRKHVIGGRRPVEMGHVVPGETAAPGRWQRAMQALVDAVDYGSGLLHGEWIDTEDGPCLIECAGRPPGDMIMDLIDLAYETNLTDLWLRLLAGQDLGPVPTPVQGAAVAFLAPAAPGTIQRISGVPQARDLPGVVRVDVRGQVGDGCGELRSSWDRIGSVIAIGADAETAEERAAAAVSQIAVQVSPAPKERDRAE